MVGINIKAWFSILTLLSYTCLYLAMHTYTSTMMSWQSYSYDLSSLIDDPVREGQPKEVRGSIVLWTNV